MRTGRRMCRAGGKRRKLGGAGGKPITAEGQLFSQSMHSLGAAGKLLVQGYSITAGGKSFGSEGILFRAGRNVLSVIQTNSEQEENLVCQEDNSFGALGRLFKAEGK